jgi:hypothetical protein
MEEFVTFFQPMKGRLATLDPARGGRTMVEVTKAGAAAELDDMSNAQSIPSRYDRECAAARQSKSEEVQRNGTRSVT